MPLSGILPSEPTLSVIIADHQKGRNYPRGIINPNYPGFQHLAHTLSEHYCLNFCATDREERGEVEDEDEDNEDNEDNDYDIGINDDSVCADVGFGDKVIIANMEADQDGQRADALPSIEHNINSLHSEGKVFCGEKRILPNITADDGEDEDDEDDSSDDNEARHPGTSGMVENAPVSDELNE